MRSTNGVRVLEPDFCTGVVSAYPGRDRDRFSQPTYRYQANHNERPATDALMESGFFSWRNSPESLFAGRENVPKKRERIHTML